MVTEQDGTPSTHSRRDVLKAGAALVAGSVAADVIASGLTSPAQAAASRRPQSIKDIEHVVILMQENRPFDHYYGTLSGVRGFSDPTADPSVFRQLDADLLQNPSGQPYMLPWHFDTKTTSAQVAGGNEHSWYPQHQMWNEGLMDQFVVVQRVADDIVAHYETPLPLTDNGAHVMSYFKRDDIPYYYALADAFTICDNYHCSVLGPTNPNRLMHITGTIDPDGTLGGGPAIDNSQNIGQLRWETYSERLQAAGIDWYVYQENDNNGDNLLNLFANFTDTKTEIYRRGLTFIPTPKGQLPGPALAEKIRQDVVSGNLPQVSWVYASFRDCEHPEAMPADGANFYSGVLNALMADPKVWAKTVLLLNYDENDGKFDHVTPPTAPLGTPGEYISLAGDLFNPGSSMGIPGPVGLGFRVPLILASPFTRGGLVCSDVLDHTSVLRFLEQRFGVEVPYLSEWRRKTVGDLTSAFNFAAPLDPSIPKLPDAAALAALARSQQHLPAPTMPAVQTMPVQEAGPPRPRPSGPVS